MDAGSGVLSKDQEEVVFSEEPQTRCKPRTFSWCVGKYVHPWESVRVLVGTYQQAWWSTSLLVVHGCKVGLHEFVGVEQLRKGYAREYTTELYTGAR